MANTPGKGTDVKLTISATPTTVVQMVNVTSPQMENPEIDTTVLSDSWRTFIASIPDGGEVTLTMNYDASQATHAQLTTNFAAGTSGTWKITFTDPGAATIEFAGPITAFAWGEAAVDNLITASVTIKVTGSVTITA